MEYIEHFLLNKQFIGQNIAVRGFVAKVRNLGGMIFIDLRDRTGIIQLVIMPEHPNYERAKEIKNECVILAQGTIVERESKNKELQTGDIEIIVEHFEVMSKAKTTPLIIAEQTDAKEEIRFKYRYLDLRRPNIQQRFFVRHRLNKYLHHFLDQQGFIEIETPMLSKSTPEGARDYLVPSRIHEAEFYALPQSPQLYKQLLMLAGFEKYYQIVRCFRDEDLRTDRQPEFTQLDMEMAYASEEKIYTLVEQMLKGLFKELIDVDIQTPFVKMSYEMAMDLYGSDKPDLRFEMKLIDVTEWGKTSEFGVFQQAPMIKMIVLPQGDKCTRKEIDQLTDFVKIYQAKGLAWMKKQAESFTGPIAKFFTANQLEALQKIGEIQENDAIFFIADEPEIARNAAGQLRLKLAQDYLNIDTNTYAFAWIVDWPLFEYDETQKRYTAAHHPFTAPQVEQEALINSTPEQVKARAYDIVLNGYEIGGGSIRIHNPELQRKMFATLGFTEKEMEKQFGFLLEAYEYGAPIHGGIAFGLDRLMMILTDTNLISDVIAFPKTLSARDLMMQAPSSVTAEQLGELHIDLKNKNK